MSDNNSIFEPAIDKKVEISYDSLPNSSFEDVNLGGAKFSNVNLKEAVSMTLIWTRHISTTSA